MSTGDNVASTAAIERRGAARTWWFGRRRRWFVPGSKQARALLWVSSVTFLLLAALDFTIYKLQQAQSAQILLVAPELSEMILGQDRLQMVLVHLGSVVALLAVMLVTIFETHKTAGPLFNLLRKMDLLGREGSSVRVRFRKEDHLHELETAFNKMALSLETRSRVRANEVHKLSLELREMADGLSRPSADVGLLPSRLHQLAAATENLKLDLERG